MKQDFNEKIKELKQLRATEHFKSVISMAELALKNAILINGGGAVALMTFVGNGQSNKCNFVVFGLFAFAIGVSLGAFATYFGYLSQNEFMRQINEREPMNDGIWQKYAAIRLCGLSYIAFTAGVFLTGFGFLVINNLK